MNWQYTPYVLPLLATLAVAAAIAFVAWRRRHVPGASSLFVLMLALAEWSIGGMLEVGCTSIPAKLFWANLEYLGIVTAPVAWLSFAMQYAGREKRLTIRNLVLLSIVPLVTFVMVWTNDLHGLMRLNVRLDTSGPFPVIDKTYGPWFWAHVAYSYMLISAGTLLLAHAFLMAPRLYRGQAGVLLIGALIPWVANALYITGHDVVPGLDTTPCAIALSGLLMAWGIFRFHVLDIVPLARGAVIESIADGVLVLDARDRILDLNPAAEGIIGSSSSRAIGHAAVQVLPGTMSAVKSCLEAVAAARDEFALGEGDARRCYEIRVSPLRSGDGRLTGRLLVMHDMTEQKRAEVALRESKQKIEGLHEIARRLGTCETEDAVYGLTAYAVERILGFPMCRIGVMDTGELTIKAASFEAPPEASEDLRFCDRLAEKASRSGETYVLRNLPDCPGAETAQGYFRSAVIAPIGKSGVVQILSPEVKAFAADDMRMLELLVGHVAEALKRIRLQNELKEQAVRDPLTGLYNRRYFSQMIEREVERSRRYGHGIAFVMVDVNYFKEINDRLGHETGDHVIQEIGELLQRQVRESDTVVRYGGDEFLIVMPETQMCPEAVAQRLRVAVVRWSQGNHVTSFPVSLAIGTSCWDPASAEPVGSALREADRRMYEDKARQVAGGHPTPPAS